MLRLFQYHLSRVHAFESVEPKRDISKCKNKSLKSSLIVLSVLTNQDILGMVTVNCEGSIIWSLNENRILS